MPAASPYLLSVTGMYRRKGAPDGGQVKNLLLWWVWQVEGRFGEQRLRAFSSVLYGKGLPKEKDVQAIFKWPCWQLNGAFSYRLFRSVSSMLNGKGLPKEGVVAACMEWLSGADDHRQRDSPADLSLGSRAPLQVIRSCGCHR